MADHFSHSLSFVLLNASEALLTLLNIMAAPAVLLIVFGGLTWYRASSFQMEDRVKMGKMLLMFGIILLVIVLITTYFLTQLQVRKQVSIF